MAKRSPENQRKVMVWSPDRIELLLAYLKEYKSTCEFNGRNFEQDLAAMYTEIHKCLAKDYPEEFGPQVTTEPSMPIKDMDSSEYQAFKKTLDKEQELIKKGYDRVKEKIRNVRQDFRTAVNKGTRSGSSKIVQENFELLTDIWGGSPATTALPFGQPVSSGWVARLSWVDFFHVNTIPRGTGVRFIRAFDNLARQKQAGKQNGVHSLSTW